MYPALILLASAALASSGLAQLAPREDWRAMARKRYPQLDVATSEISKAYAQVLTEWRTTKAIVFKDPRWPMLVAEEADIRARSKGIMEKQGRANKVAETGPRKLTLRQTWDSKTSMSAGGGSATMADLKRLLSTQGTPSAEIMDLEPVELYSGVTYLMPLRDAKEQLGVARQLPSKTKVACAGFPDGLFYHAFDGKFDGRFNRLYVVTDLLEQVAGIHLVDESPASGAPNVERGDWRTYNFVNARVKARANLRVGHRATKSGELTLVNSELYDPEKGKFVEVSRSILPQPIVNTILHCVQ